MADVPQDAITLAQAGKLFDPPRSRRAVDRLARRGVLATFKDDHGRVLTTREALEAYVEAPTSRGARLKREADLEDVPPPPWLRGAHSDERDFVIAEMAQEIARLRVEIARLRGVELTSGLTSTPERERR